MIKGFLYPDDAIIAAPLSGFTDYPYRHIARRYGCRYAFTEMVDVASLTFARARGEKMLIRGDDEDFLGIQIVGSNHEFIKTAVDVLNGYNFNVLDFNLGCPVPKVAKKGAGAELGRHLDQALACFSLIRERSRHRVSAKIRIIAEDDPAPTLALAKGLAQIGAEAITIHGRIKEAFYSGPVHFDIIRQVREALPDTQIIANGGIMDKASYDLIRQETGCTAVMTARGAMGNPWLYRELTAPDFLPPSREEVAQVMRDHIYHLIDFYGELTAMKLSRKLLHDYFKGRGFSKSLKNEISFLETRASFDIFISKLLEK